MSPEAAGRVVTLIPSRHNDVIVAAAIIDPTAPSIQQREFVREAILSVDKQRPCARRVTLHVNTGPRVWRVTLRKMLPCGHFRVG